MAMFSYRCEPCGLTYEVARAAERADDAAFCPVCGEAISRIRQSVRSRIGSFARLFVHAHGAGPGQHRHW